MKKLLFTLLAACMLLSAGMAFAAEAPGAVLAPLPDATMESLDNSIAAAALQEGGVYRDDAGEMRMRLEIYTYDKYDLVEVSALKAGGTLVLCGEEVPVASVETGAGGTILINGGLEQGGVDLMTDDGGLYYAVGYNDAKYWYPVGEADRPLSPGFVFTDESDLEKEEPTVLHAEDFLREDSGISYFFLPENTTVRFEEGVIVEMTRTYIP